MQVDGQLHAFAEQLQPYSPLAAKACRSSASQAADSQPSSASQPPLNRPPEGRWRTSEGRSSRPQEFTNAIASLPRETGAAVGEDGAAQIAIQCTRLLPLRSLRSLSGDLLNAAVWHAQYLLRAGCLPLPISPGSDCRALLQHHLLPFETHKQKLPHDHSAGNGQVAPDGLQAKRTPQLIICTVMLPQTWVQP